MPMNFKAAFKHTPLSVRWILGIMFVAGWCGVAAGVVGDLHDVWTGLAFTLNVLTALIGFCIGVPVAFFIIATVVEQRADLIEAEAINTLTAEAWTGFRDAALSLCDDDLEEVLIVRTPPMIELYRATLTSARQHLDEGDDESLSNCLRVAGEDLKEMLFAAKPMIPDSADYRVKWISITNKWKLIDEQVRIRRMEKNLSWLHEDVDSVLSSLCDHRRTPLDDFYATFSIGAGTDHVVRAMDQVSKLFLKLANSETDTIRNLLFSDTASPLRYGPEKQHEFNADQSAKWVRTLRLAVAGTASTQFPS
ncbi:hypothetical protein Rwratislav_00520 [Rhodococcus wratislaviensis IFP 2016]|nr:hypothetical protein Rwratislav_00520 [Rhodococcus wratislaviensis IFP 2016]